MTAVTPLLEARNLRKAFTVSGAAWENTKGRTQAVDGVSLEILRGETFGVVGESGCGKTTLARMLLRLIEPDAGEIRFAGEDWLAARGSQMRAFRRRMQIVFQDPMASLDPRMRVEAIVGERQRIGIARALILRPELIVADEPVSALDVSIGAQILELLEKLQREFSLTLLLISHNLPVVAQLASRVAVMQAGRFVETGSAAQVLSAPEHPYTQTLLAAVPRLP